MFPLILRSPSAIVLFVCVMATVCVLNYHKVNTSPLDAAGAAEPSIGDDGFIFLAGITCKDEEVLMHGVEPECEPTCSNPRPICRKIFVFDSAQCFCKPPTVRNEVTKKCVPVSECPKKRIQ